MNTTIYFVRHAHSHFDLKNERLRELSEKGWNDVSAVTDILTKEQVNRIYSSTYTRAVQTVEEYAKSLNQVVEVDERLREGMLSHADFHFENANASLKFAMENPDFTYDGGESRRSIQARGVEALKEIVAKHQGEKIAIGTHGYILMAMMNHIDSSYGFDFFLSTTNPDIYRVEVSPEFELVDMERLWK
ncbi:histidine phosphatase family protein [Mangrovibacillus cuniculi]|uniref:Histidine phosphatase family protein n=1 Tax=Mangrovibacillus cuniculi TaxID=2593652 RepID=A0A7S8HE70_9BACI|nr:histidine phosphatase family protein [Mangrovibacillus cuniculi]QPC45529.1 histidine phosphatase family protein [Mangrovibacillus cuniculi]